jgi:hypothetical protein
MGQKGQNRFDILSRFGYKFLFDSRGGHSVSSSKITYRDAGVDIDAGNQFVKLIRPLVKATSRPEVMADIGGFGGLFSLSTNKYRNPVLVSGTDGVGTKLKVAFQADRHDTVGIDLVAMCVNDIVLPRLLCHWEAASRKGGDGGKRDFGRVHPGRMRPDRWRNGGDARFLCRRRI